ncbi:MAG: XRE family transcriptional regulator [Clostridia bacterium]|nr:XRE family transcriptional regulator [Clostridia bacterium]
MGRASIKENKNIYQLTREELGYTRERAQEVLGTVSAERIEKIENEKTIAYPEEILCMAEKYNEPKLCNYYCSNECPIGKKYVPEIKTKELAQIVLEILASLNSMERKKERFIEIAADGTVRQDELEDFVYIQKELERISITVEALQLWTEKMISLGVIDRDSYEEELKK